MLHEKVLPANQALNYADNDDLFSSPTSTEYAPAHYVARGVIAPGSKKAEIIASAQKFNGGVPGVETQKKCEIVFVLDELDAMNADLDALRLMKAMTFEQAGALGLALLYGYPASRLTPKQQDEIEQERIGSDFSEQPYLY